MSGTHTHAGLPKRALKGRLGASRRPFVLLVAVLSMFSLVSVRAALPKVSHSERWSAVQFSAAETESLTGISFWTSADGMGYSLAVYRQLENGVPTGLLATKTGEAGTPGLHTVDLKKPISLDAGECYVVLLGLRGERNVDFSKWEAQSLEPAVFDSPQGFFSSTNGAGFVAASSDPFSIHVRTTRDTAPVPEAVTISKFVITTSPVVVGSPMTFTVSAAGTAIGDVLDYIIDYGDGTAVPPAPGSALCTTSPVVDCETATHTYAVAGTYTAKITVTDLADSTTATATCSVPVEIALSATADPLCGLAALNVCFTVSASGGTPPYSYAWTFGDGSSTPSEQNPCHAYVQAGTYTATVTVHDAIGATGTASFTIHVVKPLLAQVTASTTDGLDPTVVNFCVNASQGLPPYSYSWDFGDNSQSGASAQCPQHAFNGVGAYDVTCTVSDSCGQTTTSTPVTVTVHTAPWIRILTPVTGATVHGSVTLTSSVLVESGVTVNRVEYYVNGTFIGYATAAPWTVVWDTAGLNGSFVITAKAYDTKSRVNSTEVGVTVGVLNPTLDGRIAIAKRQFRLKVYGLNFAHGCVVRINGVPAPASVRKGMTLVVAKGGTSLKYMVPKGVPVLITVTNPDGGISNQVAFQR